MSKILNRVLITASMILLIVLLLSLDRPVLSQREVLKDEDNEAFIMPERTEAEILSLRSLAIHFPDERVVVPIVEKVEEIVVQPRDTEPRFTNEVKYISSAVRDGVKSYYFKESSSGRIYQVSPGSEGTPWDFLSDEGDYFLLKNNETIWKVRK